MRIFILIMLCFGLSRVQGQEFKNFDLIEKSVINENHEKEQHHIEVTQFLDQCIYDQKCGVFLSNSFKRFGVIKGTFLSIDRRLRCNSLTKSQILPVRFDTKGLIKDHAEDYSF